MVITTNRPFVLGKLALIIMEVILDMVIMEVMLGLIFMLNMEGNRAMLIVGRGKVT